MDEAVCNRIRIILMDYRSLGLNADGERLDWADLAAMIAAHSELATGKEMELPQNSLQNFVRGLPHRDLQKRKLGLRHYSVPEAERMDMIVAFLTSPESEGYFCSNEELFETSGKQAPVFLLNYLQFDKQPDQYLSAEHLRGRYFCTEDSEEALGGELQFLNGSENGIVLVDVMMPNRINRGRQKFSGWGVLSPEENLYLFVQDKKRGANLYYWSLGLDNSIYALHDNPPSVLVLLEHDFPVDNIEVQSGQGGKILLQSVKDEIADQIMLFERDPDFY